jgi:hypothetical protein
MLLSFRVANHRSLRDEQQLNLAWAFTADRPEGADWPAVPVAAIFGANASGKSNLIDALSYLRVMALRSDRETEPGYGIERSPFVLDPDMATEDSWFVIDAVIDHIRFTYGFALNDSRITNEWLYRYPAKQRQIVFERKDGNYRFGTTVQSELRRITEITPDSVLFITSAARYAQNDVLPVYRWLRDMEISDSSRETHRGLSRTAAWLATEDNRRKALNLLKFADFGIRNVIAREVDASEPLTQRSAQRYFEMVLGTTQEGRNTFTRVRREFLFEMSGSAGGVFLTLDQQSGGTRTFLTLLPSVLGCLETGSVMVIDELESNLHPNLAQHVVRLFQSPESNPHGAQLVFTTHNASLLGSNFEILKRDQIWFVEKGGDGATVTFPLSDFKPRNKENTERRYLGGGYGAVPFVDDELAIAALQHDTGSDAEEAGGGRRE